MSWGVRVSSGLMSLLTEARSRPWTTIAALSSSTGSAAAAGDAAVSGAGVVGAGRVPHGYLDARRFAAVDGHHAVTDVFHDEAIAYAHWFGKSITGRFTLQAASALLFPDELDALMPPGTALWDAAEYLEGEREAVPPTRMELHDGEPPAVLAVPRDLDHLVEHGEGRPPEREELPDGERDRLALLRPRRLHRARVK